MITHSRQAAFIATLGTEPQVVTLTLDLLADKGWTFDEVIVIHTSKDGLPIKSAIEAIQGEFRRGIYHQQVRVAEPTCVPLTLDGRDITDIYTEAEAGAVFRVIYDQVRAQKERQRIVHLNVAGGRKGMTAFGMAAAQLLFDDSDCLWLLSSEDGFARRRLLHATSPRDAQLIPVPVLRWSLISSSLRLFVDDPFEAIQRQRDYLAAEYRERSERFLDMLASSERKVVDLFVRDPSLSNADIAERLNFAPKVIGNLFTNIYDKARAHYGLRPEAAGKREVLVGLLAPYYAWLDRRDEPGTL
jgi:CRISPR-associated protein Csx14